jgi:predicted MFS family arabinose efflux permease
MVSLPGTTTSFAYHGTRALNGSVLYLGIAAGAGIGGLILAYTSVSLLGVIAGIAEALALGTLLLSAVRSSAAIAPVAPGVEGQVKAKSLR